MSHLRATPIITPDAARARHAGRRRRRGGLARPIPFAPASRGARFPRGTRTTRTRRQGKGSAR
jgi:hypothetical protein